MLVDILGDFPVVQPVEQYPNSCDRIVKRVLSIV